MTITDDGLSRFLIGLVRDEDAAQRYLLDPHAALANAGLSSITSAEVDTVAHSLGLLDHAARNEPIAPTEAIRNVLLHNYIDGRAYQNILSRGDLTAEFGPLGH